MSSLSTSLGKVYELLSQRKCRGYIVGGFIRDWLLDRLTNDVDIAVSGNALSIAKDVAKELDGKFVLLDEVNGIARVVITEKEQQNRRPCGVEWHLDFSSFSGDIESDLARRDFTINAMATELNQLDTIVHAAKRSQLKLIDSFSGKKDLENKLVRAVSDQIFEADAVRLLRAVRLAAELDFTIEPETEGLIRCYSQSITKIPGERIREELLRLLSLSQAAAHLRYLDQLGLLLALIPELAESKGVEQPTVHFWDVFDHSLETVAAIEFLIRENAWEYGNEAILAISPWSDVIDAHLSQEVSSGSNHKALLKLGGLLHDIAKPRTKTIDDMGRAHFLGHAKDGAVTTASILERLRFSNREINLVENLVYHHLRPAQMANEGLPTQRAIYRYFRDTGDAGIDILILALADYLASRGPLVSMEEWKKHCHLINYILTEHDKQQDKVLPLKLIDGHDLINILGLTPGPLVGELLAMVREAQASGELSTREEALALVQKETSLRVQQNNLAKTKVK
jgi:tRNA nucleotidyltransferase/poly(A) polymerase